MPKYEVIIAPDPRLNEVSKPVEKVDAEIQKLMDDLLETIKGRYAGVAAPQVGIHKRIFLMDISSYVPENKEMYFVVNPEVTYVSKETWIADEGCVSFPVGRVPVERPQHIKLSYLDYHGKKKEIEADGWLARGFLHELDHLNGVTLLDHMSKLKRSLYTKKLLKYKKRHNIA